MTKICDFPYPIYDLTKNLIPYLWTDPYINTLFQTCLIIISLVQTSVKGNVHLLLLGRLQDFMCKEVASSKKTNSRLECKNRYPIYDHNGGKIAIIDTLCQTHVANYCKFMLNSVRMLTPGQTIAAPYSQGNELVFGQNAGQQCVAMSL